MANADDAPQDSPPPATPAQWATDPHDPSQLRWWDGSVWTDHTAPITQPPPPPSAQVESVSSGSGVWQQDRLIALGLAAGVIVGSLGPWATATTIFGTISASGTQGDGQLTIIGGVLIGLGVFLSKPLLSVIFAVLTSVIAIYDIVNVSASIDDNDAVGVSVGWGLWATAVCAGASVLINMQAMRKRRSEKAAISD